MSDLDPVVVQIFGPPPSDVDLDEDIVTRNNATTISLMALAIVSVVARLFARRMRHTALEADDYTIILALVLSICTAVVNILFGPAGSGHHVWALTTDILSSGFKVGFVYTFMWAVSVSITKISIVLFYRRLFAINKRFRFWLDILMAVIICQTIAITVANLTVCRPLHYLWDRLKPGATGTCFDQFLFLLVAGIINACLDIIILAAPIYPITKLQLSTKKKLGVCAMMLLGCIVCVASWIRVYYLVLFRTAVDTTWLSGQTATWSSIESSLGIVSACLPVLRPIYSKIRQMISPKSSGKDQGGSSSRSGYQGPTAIGSDWSRISERQAKKQTELDDTITLTSFHARGNAEEDSDRIVIRSELRQTHSYV